MTCVVRKLTVDTATSVRREALYKMLTLLLYTGATLEKVSSKDVELKTRADKRINQMFTEMHKTLSEDWIVRHYSHVFGDPNRAKFSHPTQDAQVLK